jgi:hypothetical protein
VWELQSGKVSLAFAAAVCVNWLWCSLASAIVSELLGCSAIPSCTAAHCYTLLSR